MTYGTDNRTGLPAPSPCRSHGQAADAAVELLAGKARELREALTRQHAVSIGAVLGVFAAILSTGAGKRGSWEGYYGELEKRAGVSYRVVRRSLMVLRGLGLVAGDAPEPTPDRDGKLRRGATRLELLLPAWARSRTWRSRSKTDVEPAHTSGHPWPASRPVSPPDAYNSRRTVPEPPVDERISGPRRLLPSSWLTDPTRLRLLERRRR